MGWNLQNWDYYKDKYCINEARKLAACYGIKFDDILTIFNINPKNEYQTNIYKFNNTKPKGKYTITELSTIECI
jgi:hypothetical protein